MFTINSLKIYAAIIITMLCWGLSYIATKIALMTFSVNALVLVRFCTASLVFFLLLLIKGFPRFRRKDHIKIAVTSFFFPFSFYFLETTALNYTSASEASIIAALIPMVVLLLSAFFLKERISAIGAGGIIVSFMGIIALVLGNLNNDIKVEDNLLGNLLMMGAVISASIYMILTRDLGKKYSSFDITSTQIIYGTFIFISINFMQINHLSPEFCT